MRWTGCERKDDEEHTNCFTQDCFNVDLRDSAAKQRKGTPEKEVFLSHIHTKSPPPHINIIMQQLFTFVPALLAHHKKNPKHVAKASRSIKQHDTKGGSEEQKRGRWHEQQQQQSFVACFSFVRTKKKGCHRSVSVVCRQRYTTNAHACTAAPNHGYTQRTSPNQKKKDDVVRGKKTHTRH